MIEKNFYKMPKIFFEDSKYKDMKNDSKLSYMILLDLLPLSKKNKWINEDGEYYVKLSRNKLMKILNVKGTQKMAQIMRELVDHKLIINKRVGLTKCNEIYILMPDIKTNLIPSFYPEVRDDEEDFKTLHKTFSERLHIDYLKGRYDNTMVDEIINNICHMYTSNLTVIGGQVIPRSAVRGVLDKLEVHHIEHVIRQYLETAQEQKIRNTIRYMQTLIYNSVFEAGSRVRGQIRHDFGY